MRLDRISLRAGRYEGLLTAADAPATIEAVHLGEVVAHARINHTDEGYRVAVDLPATVLADGVQVIALQAPGGEVLDRVTVMAVEALAHDIRAEMALLRAELEMLKTAFRRHCAQSDSD